MGNVIVLTQGEATAEAWGLRQEVYARNFPFQLHYEYLQKISATEGKDSVSHQVHTGDDVVT